MSRAMTNYVVDVITAVAFVIASISGIVFLLPTGWIGISASGEPGMLGVPMAMWNTLHEWSALAMIGAALLHFVLHRRWVVSMTRRACGRRRSRQTPITGVARAGATLAVDRRAAAAEPQGRGRGVEPGRDTPHVEGQSLKTRGRGERRMSRKTFLAGAAAACGGAAVAVLLGRGGGESGAVSAEPDPGLQSDGNGRGLGAGRSDESEGRGADELGDGSGDGSDGSGSSDGSTQPQTAPDTSTARVSVDAGACTGCGDCVGACPCGVFTFDGSRAVASSPDACVLCGRCVRVCPTQAITLRA